MLIVARLSAAAERRGSTFEPLAGGGLVVIAGRSAVLTSKAWPTTCCWPSDFAADEPMRPASWADVAFCEVSVVPMNWPRRRPIAGCRSWRCGDGDHADGVARSRAQCDRLQRDLAGHGEFAGFIV